MITKAAIGCLAALALAGARMGAYSGPTDIGSIPHASSPTAIAVTIARGGHLFIGKTDVKLGSEAAALKARGANRDALVIITANDDVDHGILTTVLGNARKAGVERFQIAEPGTNRPRPVGGPITIAIARNRGVSIDGQIVKPDSRWVTLNLLGIKQDTAVIIDADYRVDDGLIASVIAGARNAGARHLGLAILPLPRMASAAITITSSGALFLDAAPITLGTETAALKAYGDTRKMLLVINADVHIMHGMVTTVMDNARKADITDFALAARS